MCIIVYSPAGIDLPLDGIANGTETNTDGHGWAVASRDGLEVGKSMDPSVAMDAYEEARKRHGKSSLGLWHSRYGTHGVMGPFNVHPFYVDEAQETVVAHNGVLPSMFFPTHKDSRSDTRIFVDRVLKPMQNQRPGVPSRRAGKRLGDQIGMGNKLTFLSVVGGVPKVRIVNAFLGIQEAGNWFSNSGFRPSRFTYYTESSLKWKNWETWTPGKVLDDACQADADETEFNWDDFADCKVCMSKFTVEPDTMVCEVCDHCADCLTQYNDCMCYRGSHHESPLQQFAIAQRPYSWERDENGQAFERFEKKG